MVRQLVTNGANSIWEHSLLDPNQMKSGLRKPNQKDHVQYELNFLALHRVLKKHFGSPKLGCSNVMGELQYFGKK